MLRNMMGASAGSKHVRGPKPSPIWAPTGGRGRTHADGAEREHRVPPVRLPPTPFLGRGLWLGHGEQASCLQGARAVPSGAGVGAGASAQVSHPPSRSGWLADAVILLDSASTSPEREQQFACPLVGRAVAFTAPPRGPVGWVGLATPPNM